MMSGLRVVVSRSSNTDIDITEKEHRDCNGKRVRIKTVSSTTIIITITTITPTVATTPPSPPSRTARVSAVLRTSRTII